MKNVLIISKSPLDRDPRVYKQILFLKESGRYRVASAGLAASGIEDEFYRLPIIRRHGSILGRLRKAVQLKVGQYEELYWSQSWKTATYQRFAAGSKAIDLVIANDLPVLPLALRIAHDHSAGVYMDAHEYEPLHYDSFRFKYFLGDYRYWMCRRYLPMVSYMTTVSDRIAQEYSTNFGVRCEVMMNLPFYEDIEATLTSSEKIRMIHHGYATPHRRIENMINLMKHLDRRFELDLMMLGMESKYGCHLREVSLSNPRIRFVATVPMRDIVKTISVYDFGLYLLAPNTFNNRMALPNKIFEFIQGRLALAIWPSQEMVRIVKKYQNGVYSTDFNVREMAHVLNRLTNENILNMKRNSCIAANELNADNNRKQLLEIVGSLVTS